MMWKVLLVEDEVFVRESIKEIIEWEKWGFTVIGEVGSGTEALEIIKNEHPHLVITDIVMPEMDGIELLKRAREAGYQAKFVMLTCMNDLSYAIQAMEYGASSYILKLSMNFRICVTPWIKLVRSSRSNSGASTIHALAI